MRCPQADDRTSLDGALVIDKPSGPTSHDVVQKVRRCLGARVGHTGTLDPLASGVLVLLVGQATRLARFFQHHDKAYRAVIRLGVTTATYDLESPVETCCDVPALSRQEIESALQGFRGEIQQTPPMFSAVRVGGERLYEAARRGETVERKARTVSIRRLEPLELTENELSIRVDCSAGTYVRVLAHELGRKLGCGGALAELRRLRSGDYELADAVGLDDLAVPPAAGFVPISGLLPEFPRIDLSHDLARRARHGNPVEAPGHQGLSRLFYADRLIAIARQAGEVAQPIVVFSSEPD